ncbi:MAG TPA: hypothetical protein VH062_31720 [Polyangiaceae bacterium]|nr:hypothetical protein [Polyangiaceae bacterium]
MVLRRTDGGWETYYTQPQGGPNLHLTGFPGGDLLLYGAIRCGIVTLPSGAPHCSAGLSSLAGDLFVAGDGNAYAVNNDRILTYSNGHWSQLLGGLSWNEAPPGTAQYPQGWAIWADGVTIATAVIGGPVFVSREGSLFNEDTPLPLDRYRVVWGLDGHQLWVGGAGGELFSKDERGWTDRGSVVDSCGTGIKGFWGARSTLYAHAEHRLVRVDNEIEPVLEVPCTQTIRGIWGNSESEVFAVVEDETKRQSACGAVTLLRVRGRVVEAI